jgi:hypothetical protein
MARKSRGQDLNAEIAIHYYRWEFLDWQIRDRLSAAIFHLHSLESTLRPSAPGALAEEILQRVEDAGLVVLERDHETLTS